ncbi:MAG TPA: polysaccharide biosynthesis tyrosine autokinase [Longimicrobium sp.]|uniref:GumC family protein n=1 Tax=Longimicrobium sp. TaxID=2029185 RepID=UPI002ED7F1BE
MPKSLPPERTIVLSTGQADVEQTIHLRDVLSVLLRNRWLIAVVLLGTVAAMATYTFRQPRVYQSRATIRIDPEQSQMQLFGEVGRVLGGAQERIETEIMVLQSELIARQAVDSLGLRVWVMEPNAPRAAVLASVFVPESARNGIAVLTRTGNGTYTVQREDGFQGVRLPRTVTAGVPADLGGARVTLRAGTQAPVIRLAVVPPVAAARAVQAGLAIARPNPRAQLIAVRYQSTDPALAAAVPNAIADGFIAYKRGTAKSESRSTVTFLRQQVASYQADLQRAEADLRGFREQAQIVNLGEQASRDVQRLAELQARLDDLNGERQALSQFLSQLRAQPAGAEGAGRYQQLASFPVFLSNRSVGDLLQSLTTLENERGQMALRRTGANADMQNLDSRIADLRRRLDETAQGYLHGLDAQIAPLASSLGGRRSEMQSIPRREVEFARLARQQKLLEDIYTLLQTRLKEAEIKEAVEPGQIRVIDTATVPQEPISPRPLINMVLALGLGTLLSVGAAFTREALNTRIRTRQDVMTATVGLPILGMVPRIRSQFTEGGRLRILISGAGSRRASQMATVAEPLAPIVLREPMSPAAESFRALRTSLTFAGADGAPQVMMVTSAFPGDGKSTTSCNLATALAEQGTRTLLIDADLRRGGLHRNFGLRQEPGLTHVLMRSVALEDAVQRVGDTHLYVLAAGVFPPNPSELLGSQRMRELLARLREQYPAIVIDTPPVNLVTDAGVLGSLADGTILVARTGRTAKDQLAAAAGQLRHLKVPVAGVVINDYDVGQPQYYNAGYSYGYAYGGR